MEDRIPRDRPKVIYKVMLCVDHEGKPDNTLKPLHLAFLRKTEVHIQFEPCAFKSDPNSHSVNGSYATLLQAQGEYEFLFSAFSAFRVHSVKRSSKPTSAARPHEIILVACYDNADELQDAPTAPWH